MVFIWDIKNYSKLAKKYKKKYSSKIGVLLLNQCQKCFLIKILKIFRISNFEQKIDLFKKFKS